MQIWVLGGLSLNLKHFTVILLECHQERIFKSYLEKGDFGRRVIIYPLTSLLQKLLGLGS